MEVSAIDTEEKEVKIEKKKENTISRKKIKKTEIPNLYVITLCNLGYYI